MINLVSRAFVVVKIGTRNRMRVFPGLPMSAVCVRQPCVVGMGARNRVRPRMPFCECLFVSAGLVWATWVHASQAHLPSGCL